MQPQPPTSCSQFCPYCAGCRLLGLCRRARLLMVRKDYRAFYKTTEELLFMLGPDLPCTDGCFVPRFLLITLTYCSVCNSNKLIGSPQWAWWNLMACHWILGGCLLKKRNFSPSSLTSVSLSAQVSPASLGLTSHSKAGTVYRCCPSHCLLLAIWLLYSSLRRLLFQKFVPISFSRLPNKSYWCFPTHLHLYTCSHLHLESPPSPSENTEKSRFEPTRSNSRAHSFNLPPTSLL